MRFGCDLVLFDATMAVVSTRNGVEYNTVYVDLEVELHQFEVFEKLYCM